MDFSSEIIDLSGEWSITYEDGRESYCKVPGTWEGNFGSVEYELKIISNEERELILYTSLVNIGFLVYLNDVLLTEKVSNTPLYIPITLNSGENSLRVWAENHTDILSGFRTKPKLGSFNNMMDLRELNAFKDTLMAGAFAIISIFFFILYLYYKTDRASLYFSLLCLLITVRTYLINDRIIYNYSSDFPLWLLKRLEYISIYAVPLLLFLFIRNYFNRLHYRKIYTVSKYIGILFAFTPIILPQLYFTALLNFFYIFVIYSAAYLITFLIFYSLKGVEDSVLILISVVVLVLFSILDMFTVYTPLSDRMIAGNGMLLFVLFMSFMVSRRQIKTERRINRLAQNNKVVTNYLYKFVPNEFIKSCGVNEITSIKLGDGVVRDMVVLFTSIKDFQEIIKSKESEDIIEILNKTYTIISNVVSEHSGFIDKFIDETVMILFPGRVEDAINATIEIRRRLNEFNNTNPELHDIELRTGIHKGKPFIGIVGDKERVDATVISKAVNTASRINSFTRKIDRDFLISENVYNSIKYPENYNPLYMGRVKLKGKENYIGIYSIYDNEIPQADIILSKALEGITHKEILNLEEVLVSTLANYNNHKPSTFYLNMIHNNKMMEVPDK